MLSGVLNIFFSKAMPQGVAFFFVRVIKKISQKYNKKRLHQTENRVVKPFFGIYTEGSLHAACFN
jgi:hypothetical protein